MIVRDDIASALEDNTPDGIIPQFVKKVNELHDAQEMKMDRDSTGRELTPEQAEFFKDSKVNEDIRYSDRYWHTGMSNAEVTRIERLVKHELPITDNFVDNITKWMYNNKGEYTYFALYSTEDEENPTVLYASKGERADADFDFVKYYNDFVNEMDGVNNDGRAESIDEIFSQYRSTDGLYPVNSGYDVGRENTTQTVRSHIGKSRRRLPSALRSCLQDCYRRRNSQRLLDDERLGDEMHQDRNMNGATFNGKPFWCGSVSLPVPHNL